MRHRAPNSGFSLVEVMIAVVVICVGLLGIAKMQAMSLATTTTSRQRALAALQGASLASAMHSNRQYWAGNTVGAAAFTATITSGTPLPAVSVPSDVALQANILADITANPTPANPPRQCITNASIVTPMCTPTQLAAFDLARWWVVSVNPMLPNAVASVSCPLIPPGQQTPLTCIVQIQWSEQAVNMNSQSANAAAPGQFEKPTYTMYVQP